MASVAKDVAVKSDRRRPRFSKRRSASKETKTDPVPPKVKKKAANKGDGNVVVSTKASEKQKSRQKPARKCTKLKKPAAVVLASPGGTVDDDEVEDTAKSYTPLEKQVMAIKEKHPNTLLMVECGYRFRFFGEDAEIAAKELRITCSQSHNFMTASVPSHRVHVHLERLVRNGHKVGIVRQTESAALKSIGDAKSSVFSRELSSLFTRSTLVGEDLPTIGEDATSGGYLMSICESEISQPMPNHTLVGIVVVQPATGDILYDVFDENPYGSELEQRLEFLRPVEIILPEGSTTSKTVRRYESSSRDGVRVEHVPRSEFEFSASLTSLMDFYSDGEEASNLKRIFELHPTVVPCLGSLLGYLKTFELEAVLADLSRLVPLSRTHAKMQLSAATLKGLEVFHNSVDGSDGRSLFAFLNRTVTPFGCRLLESWVGQPCCDVEEVTRRQDAVEEILRLGASAFSELKKFLSRMPNVERGLCAVLHKKVKPCDVYSTLSSLASASKLLTFLSRDMTLHVESSALKECIAAVPELLNNIEHHVNLLDEDAAKKNDTTSLLRDLSKYPDLRRRKEALSKAEADLRDLRASIAAELGLRDFDYKTVNGVPYLIEVPNRRVPSLPPDWLKISATKAVSRFRSPEVNALYCELCVAKELLAAEGRKAWLEFLQELSLSYNRYQRAVKLLATLDCYFALAEVANRQGYCRPIILPKEETAIRIRNGRHPVLEQSSGLQSEYVGNDTDITDRMRCVVITGPNMGGKSSYVKQVALIAIMAQLGSFVPAESATLGLLDAVYVRMGAEDDIVRYRSTFLREMQETSDILSRATEHSLVVLDELGRGTATHDGAAIATATLRHLLEEKRCPTLFVTHYQPVTQLEDVYREEMRNFHVAFELDGEESVVFLYRLSSGPAKKSYGLNVALLAGVPSDIVARAREVSRKLRDSTRRKNVDLSDG